MTHRSDDWRIKNTHNTARFFTETPQIAWMVLVATVLLGIFGYMRMPQRKDPDIPVKVALASCPWPGVDAERVEQLVTRRIEETVAQNVRIKEIKSTTRLGVTFVTVTLKEDTDDPAKEFDDIKLRLDGITDLPQGAGPINFIRDFGSTAALMLTVASPKVGDVVLGIKAEAIADSIRQVRAQADSRGPRVTLALNLPEAAPMREIRQNVDLFIRMATADGTLRDARTLAGPGFVLVDAITTLGDSALIAYTHAFVEHALRSSEIHPDAWPPVVIRDVADTKSRLAAGAGDKYTYRELEHFTDVIRRTLQTIPIVTKVSRAGILDERITLAFSQDRLASYGIAVGRLKDLVSARNIPVAGGTVETEGKTVAVAPSGEFQNEREIGEMVVGSSAAGSPLYLRDLVEVQRAYRSPPTYLNYFTWHDPHGQWHRSRAVTLSVEMRAGAKIGKFGEAVDEVLGDLRDRLPEDLIFARTSDQPRQVEESIELFMSSLEEAIVLVVLVALVGFWEWRSAALMALSIPLTLAMTFGMMAILGIDLQQVSIASLIIALGLLVDDPVVAGDAIKRDLQLHHPPRVAAWLGPTKLATAIMYATVTNIVAYLPFLLLTGDTGRFIVTLPIVLTCSLVASRLVSMTFIPLLGYYLLRAPKKPEVPLRERRTKGFAGWYYRIGRAAIEHRKKVLLGSFGFLLLGGVIAAQLKPQFFPKDLQYLSTVDVWLPEDAALSATQQAVIRTEGLIRKVAGEMEREHGKGGHPHPILRSLTSFVGGGGPRFWSSLSPEPRQANYALIVMETYDKHDSRHLVAALRPILSSQVPGARVTAKELEVGAAVGIPVSVRIIGDDMATLRRAAEELKGALRSIPISDQVQDDWGAESFAVNFQVDPDRAHLAGVTNVDVAASTAAALNGYEVGVLREGNLQIPIVARLRVEERARLGDLQNLYVYSSNSNQKVPLRQISTFSATMQPAKLARRNQFRAITVSCYPVHGRLASEVLRAAMPAIHRIEHELPPGFEVEIAGEQEKQKDSFRELAMVMAISIAMIYIALVLQFRNTVKPLLVFAAIPYGMVGALTALCLTGTPFGFMAFLGVVSLVGVIVSHVIVLFDFIEEAHQRGESLIEALLDAGIVRLRPVLITVGATVLALFPLALHGGPLWEPLCYAQIGGLSVATFITLVLVPVLYAIFVLDLKIVRWEPPAEHSDPD
ncbi:MAG TPA: efflux RND transporter permease subunit [Candidatus Eisenbacteria bacterium]|nr:efflux RND transporter permease subunit [Candidatus Eisenbacteria bacterium]